MKSLKKIPNSFYLCLHITYLLLFDCNFMFEDTFLLILNVADLVIEFFLFVRDFLIESRQFSLQLLFESLFFCNFILQRLEKFSRMICTDVFNYTAVPSRYLGACIYFGGKSFAKFQINFPTWKIYRACRYLPTCLAHKKCLPLHTCNERNI